MNLVNRLTGWTSSVTVYLCFLLFSPILTHSEDNLDRLRRSVSLEELVRFEMEQFEREAEEFSKFQSEHHRGKRTVTFNGGAPLDLGVLIGIPLSIALPTMQNFFKWNWKWKRSLENSDYEDFEDNSIAQPYLDRISSYFELIEISERGCRERAICEFSAEPEKFYPISELVLNGIRNPHNSLMTETWEGPANTTKPRSLLGIYNTADLKGLANGIHGCAKEFSGKCPASTEQRLNMPVLRFWNLLSSLLKLSFKDNLVMHS